MEEQEFRVSPREILQQLYAIATCDVTDALEVKNGVLELRDTRQLTPMQTKAIAAMEKTSSGIKIKFYDKMRALELLGKYLSLFDPAATAQVTQDGMIDALLEHTKEALDTHDIPELQQAADSGDDLVEPGES